MLYSLRQLVAWLWSMITPEPRQHNLLNAVRNITTISDGVFMQRCFQLQKQDHRFYYLTNGNGKKMLNVQVCSIRLFRRKEIM